MIQNDGKPSTEQYYLLNDKDNYVSDSNKINE